MGLGSSKKKKKENQNIFKDFTVFLLLQGDPTYPQAGFT